MRTPNIQALVVGAGPTGLTLACDLARRGISFRIVERAEHFDRGCRSKTVTVRSLEVFDDLGIVETLRAKGPANMVMRHYDRDRVVREVDLFHGWEPTPDSPHVPGRVLAQQTIEATLRDRLVAIGADVELSTELLGYEQPPDGPVEATLETPRGVEVISADYLIGCDGGHSTVRKLGAFAFAGETWEEERMFLADVTVRGLDLSCWHMWLNAELGYLALCPMRDIDHWVFQAQVSPDAEGPSLEVFRRIFAERAGVPGVEIIDASWLSSWRPNIRVVDRYRDGCVFLAGDSAHVHSPAGGLGMNTGVQDAYNLGWKLANVLRGAPVRLLDTYETERLPVARDVLAHSSARHKGFMRPDPDAKELGHERMFGKNEQAYSMQLGVHYRGSPLALDLDDAIGIRAGDRAPDSVCVDAETGRPRRLFDAFRGPHFSLLVFAAHPPSWLADFNHPVVRAHAVVPAGRAADGNTLVDADDQAFRFYGIDGQGLVLVRPDGYVGLTTGSVRGAEPIVQHLAELMAD